MRRIATAAMIAAALAGLLPAGAAADVAQSASRQRAGARAAPCLARLSDEHPSPARAAAALTKPRAGDAWLDRVRAFSPGITAGFGADRLPDIVLGRPEGLGADQGSLDVVSLGKGGSIVVSFDDNAVMDGPGDDLVIFENAFHAGSSEGPLFTEYAFVEVSRDGRNWLRFPHDPQSGQGLAGQAPVFAASSNNIDPLSQAAGGDRFDIGALGIDLVRYVRLTDAGDEVDDYGNHSFPGTKGGFDLDAAAALHSVPLGRIAGVVTMNGQPLPGQVVRLRCDDETHWRRRRTRSDGRYRFARLLPGCDYTIRALVPGQPTQEQQTYLDLEQLQADADFAF
ncbi:MAG TPA: carboxypeptidase-like regulatory domain-containing protein [Candidatus Limnocylindrales bacterium]|nr:carboxypeptidase-like regulatory domain-containing protein [Candidatus Limnocylindrales bacterium]